jgi:hypothetical protein
MQLAQAKKRLGLRIMFSKRVTTKWMPGESAKIIEDSGMA